MAKKATPAKKRKSEKVAPREVPEGQNLGTVSIPVQCDVYVGDNVTNFDELVIEWSCLGLSEEPDKINEISGNGVLLHPDRPPATDDEGLHIFLRQPLPHGSYGFLFRFTYFDAVQARTTDPELVKKLQEAREKHEAEATAPAEAA